MNAWKTTTVFVLFLTAGLFAGDRAQFLELGFSPNGKYFAFAQYGEQDGSGFPYAEIYIVDIEKNDFVQGGVLKQLWKETADPPARGLHVMLELRVAADSLFKAYNILAQKQGRLLVPAGRGQRDSVEWKGKGGTVAAVLQQKREGDPGMFASRAAFQVHIRDEAGKSTTVGNFHRFRKNVMRYDIDRIIADDNERCFVFIIRMTKLGFEGPDIRYMVEALPWNDG